MSLLMQTAGPGPTDPSRQPQYYDRNPVFKRVLSDDPNVSEDTASQDDSYTVPAGKKAIILTAEAFVHVAAAASTTTATDQLVSTVRLDDGTLSAEILAVTLRSDTVAANDWRSEAVSPGIVVGEGTTVTARRAFQGDAGGTGRAKVSALAGMMEFDA